MRHKVRTYKYQDYNVYQKVTSITHDNDPFHCLKQIRLRMKMIALIIFLLHLSPGGGVYKMALMIPNCTQVHD